MFFVLCLLSFSSYFCSMNLQDMRHRYTNVLLVALLLAVESAAQPVCSPVKMVQNMGDIMYRSPHSTTFEIKNTGDAPLAITSAVPSCGCTKVAYDPAPIAPGAVSRLSVTYDAAMMGTFHKEVELMTNASPEPVYLVMQGRVTDDPSADISDYPIDLDNVRINTNVVEYDDVNKGDCPVAELLIVNSGSMAYQPQLMHLPPFLSAAYEPAIVPPGRTGRIRLTLDSERLPDMGLTQRPIYLARYLGDKVSSGNEISVSAVLLPEFGSKSARDIAPRMELSDVAVDLGAFGKKKKLTTTITISNKGGSTLHISRLQAFSKALAFSCDSSIKPGKKTKIKVTVNRDWMTRDKNQLRILLICDDPAHPKQTITLKVQP